MKKAKPPFGSKGFDPSNPHSPQPAPHPHAEPDESLQEASPPLAAAPTDAAPVDVTPDAIAAELTHPLTDESLPVTTPEPSAPEPIDLDATDPAALDITLADLFAEPPSPEEILTELNLEPPVAEIPSESPTPNPQPPEPLFLSPEEVASLLNLLGDLQQQNLDLRDRVIHLETAIQATPTPEVSLPPIQEHDQLLAQTQQELAIAHEQNQRLLHELEASHQVAQRQQILIETLNSQLENSQERVAQLERECALTKQHNSEQAHRLLQTENLCRDLRSRLHRQQRYTLQFKAALEKCLEMPPASLQTPHESPALDLGVSATSKAQVFLPKVESIQPWSTQATPEAESTWTEPAPSPTPAPDYVPFVPDLPSRRTSATPVTGAAITLSSAPSDLPPLTRSPRSSISFDLKRPLHTDSSTPPHPLDETEEPATFSQPDADDSPTWVEPSLANPTLPPLDLPPTPVSESPETHPSPDWNVIADTPASPQGSTPLEASIPAAIAQELDAMAQMLSDLPIDMVESYLMQAFAENPEALPPLENTEIDPSQWDLETAPEDYADLMMMGDAAALVAQYSATHPLTPSEAPSPVELDPAPEIAPAETSGLEETAIANDLPVIDPQASIQAAIASELAQEPTDSLEPESEVIDSVPPVGNNITWVNTPPGTKPRKSLASVDLPSFLRHRP